MKKMKPRGMTLIELLITLVIAATLLTLGVSTMTGYLPKQRLLNGIQQLESSLQRAQSEATAKGFWSCVKFTDSKTFEIWIDKDINHGTAAGACGSAGDSKIGPTYTLKSGVALAPASGAGCTENVQGGCIIWFEAGSGIPKRCNFSGNCGVTTPSSCIDSDFQIVLSQADMGSGTRARELEVTAGGLIQAVKLGTQGLNTTLWAKIPPYETGGCE